MGATRGAEVLEGDGLRDHPHGPDAGVDYFFSGVLLDHLSHSLHLRLSVHVKVLRDFGAKSFHEVSVLEVSLVL
jgi:hypothetical protein